MSIKYISVVFSISAFILSGCSFKETNIKKNKIDSKLINKKSCVDLKIKSFEQQFQDAAKREGFLTYIINDSKYNPLTTKIKSLDDLIFNKDDSDIIIKIPTILNNSKLKKVYISKSSYSIENIKKLKKIFYSFNSPSISSGEIMKLINKNGINITGPLKFYSYPVSVVAKRPYSLYTLLNIMSERLSKENDISFIFTANEIIIKNKPLIKELDKKTISFLDENGLKYSIKDNKILINTNFIKNLFLLKVKSSKNLYKNNRYLVCSKKENFVLKDGVSKNNLYIKKLDNQLNSISRYSIVIDGEENKISTNDKSITLSNHYNENLLIYLY